MYRDEVCLKLSRVVELSERTITMWLFLFIYSEQETWKLLKKIALNRKSNTYRILSERYKLIQKVISRGNDL